MSDDKSLVKTIVVLTLIILILFTPNPLTHPFTGGPGRGSHHTAGFDLWRYLNSHAPVLNQSDQNDDGYGGRNRTTPAGDKLLAPGMPTSEDGYEPPKNWDGKKVRNRKGRGSGVPDKHGDIWVPSGLGGFLPGTDGRAHSGPHWDIQEWGKKGGYRNVRPAGGKTRWK